MLCKGTVEHRLGRVTGVTSYTVEVKSDSATVIYDANAVTAAQIAQAVAEVGYQAREVVEVN